MWSRIFCILSLCFVSIGQCAVFYESIKIPPGEPLVCKAGDLPLSITVGESMKHPEYCLEYSCSHGRKKNELLLTGTTCGTIKTPPNCTLNYPIEDKYPECCHFELICP
uniref:Secreted Single domain von Willebrand protein n=1 Tax=Pristhesancus plagipennis TaxID=1955184 RepID=A0A2K8JMP4_PRIPG|nr:secreted Single domain von Willebrand protein [Pristhesancus plagipennis]